MLLLNKREEKPGGGLGASAEEPKGQLKWAAGIVRVKAQDSRWRAEISGGALRFPCSTSGLRDLHFLPYMKYLFRPHCVPSATEAGKVQDKS